MRKNVCWLCGWPAVWRQAWPARSLQTSHLHFDRTARRGGNSADPDPPAPSGEAIPAPAVDDPPRRPLRGTPSCCRRLSCSHRGPPRRRKPHRSRPQSPRLHLRSRPPRRPKPRPCHHPKAERSPGADPAVNSRRRSLWRPRSRQNRPRRRPLRRQKPRRPPPRTTRLRCRLRPPRLSPWKAWSCATPSAPMAAFTAVVNGSDARQPGLTTWYRSRDGQSWEAVTPQQCSGNGWNITPAAAAQRRAGLAGGQARRHRALVVPGREVTAIPR